MKNLKNTIFSYSNKKPKDYEIESEEYSSTSENESSAEEKYNNNNKFKKHSNKKKNRINNDNLYFGILIILGLFTLKTFFSTINNGFFSLDNLLNVLILISIFFVLYTAKQ